jgi:hypothetical protein
MPIMKFRFNPIPTVFYALAAACALANSVHAGPIPNAGGYTNIAHYSFDSGGSPFSLFTLGEDSSGNGNDLGTYTYWGPLFQFSTDAEAGGGAVQFVGTSVYDAFDQSFTAWTNTLAGSFSVSVWINTTNQVGNNGDNLNGGNGQSVVYTRDYSGGATPVAIIGSKAAFYTVDTNGNQDTLHSQQSVTMGSYVHIVSTRDQNTGQKCIYINGQLDSSNYASTGLLTGATAASIGGGVVTSDYIGWLDDVQIYSGTLQAADVSNLYVHPGTALLNSAGFVSDATGHTNIAHYTFDNGGSPYTLGTDSSGNGNNLPSYTYWGPLFQFSTDAEVGGGAIQFVGTSILDALEQTFTVWTNTLAGSCSVSAWVNTSTTVGNNSDNLNGANGQSVVYTANQNGGATPIALIGSKAAFYTVDTNGNKDTLHSQTSVAIGSYVQVVSTRNQSTGEKCIYVNGQLDNSNYASVGLLTGATAASIGGGVETSDYTGLVDDVQIYSGALQATEVGNLYANPGTTIPNLVGPDSSSSAALGAAVNATNLTWATSGETAWFAETNTSYDNVSAAQSGILFDSQASILQTTVTGPGTLTFWWQTMADDDSFDLEFEIDGIYGDDISFDSSWSQDNFDIAAGRHVLTWDANTYADTGSSTNDTGWVDEVVFTPTPTTPSSANLINPGLLWTNYYFSFVSQPNHTNLVQYTTSVQNPTWLPYKTIIGDGATISVIVPVGSPAQQFFRVETQ